jgi:hypothetical protein
MSLADIGSALAATAVEEQAGGVSRDDEDRRQDGDGSPVGGDPFSLDDLVIPDDLRELDAEVRALQRERRAQARAAGLRRLLPPGRWRQYGMSGPIVIGVLLVLAGIASLMLMFPARRTATKPAPIATGVRPPGQEGGLVPDVMIHRADGDVLPLRDYRPAVVALLPASCGCDRTLRTFGVAAFRHQLAFVLVGKQMPALPPELTDRAAVLTAEPTGRVLTAYRVDRRPVLLMVGGNGVVDRVLVDEPTPSALDVELANLVSSGSGGGPG